MSSQIVDIAASFLHHHSSSTAAPLFFIHVLCKELSGARQTTSSMNMAPLVGEQCLLPIVVPCDLAELLDFDPSLGALVAVDVPGAQQHFSCAFDLWLKATNTPLLNDLHFFLFNSSADNGSGNTISFDVLLSVLSIPSSLCCGGALPRDACLHETTDVIQCAATRSLSALECDSLLENEAVVGSMPRLDRLDDVLVSRLHLQSQSCSLAAAGSACRAVAARFPTVFRKLFPLVIVVVEVRRHVLESGHAYVTDTPLNVVVPPALLTHYRLEEHRAYGVVPHELPRLDSLQFPLLLGVRGFMVVRQAPTVMSTDANDIASRNHHGGDAAMFVQHGVFLRDQPPFIAASLPTVVRCQGDDEAMNDDTPGNAFDSAVPKGIGSPVSSPWKTNAAKNLFGSNGSSNRNPYKASLLADDEGVVEALRGARRSWLGVRRAESSNNAVLPGSALVARAALTLTAASALLVRGGPVHTVVAGSVIQWHKLVGEMLNAIPNHLWVPLSPRQSLVPSLQAPGGGSLTLSVGIGNNDGILTYAAALSDFRKQEELQMSQMLHRRKIDVPISSRHLDDVFGGDADDQYRKRPSKEDHNNRELLSFTAALGGALLAVDDRPAKARKGATGVALRADLSIFVPAPLTAGMCTGGPHQGSTVSATPSLFEFASNKSLPHSGEEAPETSAALLGPVFSHNRRGRRSLDDFQLSQVATQLIHDFYIALRGYLDTVPPGAAHTLKKLAVASAVLRERDDVTACDAIVAIALYDYTLRPFSLFPPELNVFAALAADLLPQQMTTQCQSRLSLEFIADVAEFVNRCAMGCSLSNRKLERQ